MQLKANHVETLMHFNSAEASSIHVDVEWKFGERVPPEVLSSSTDHGSKSQGLSSTAITFHQSENASQVAEIVNGVSGAVTLTANYVGIWSHPFRLCIFNVKDEPHTGRPVVENVDKMTEIIKVDRHVSSHSIARELKIDHKTVLNLLRKVGFKKKLAV
ncbi:histone-lysine N-methyltransferase SETMAR [Trichonephila clavipes]|nr:histone-lysine N-methyltransferase SETMAR [Trichonephila clavipes]